MMQIINNTGAIIKEQINLGNIDNLNIDDLFKNNTNNKKMKNNNCPNWLVPFDIAFMLERIGFDEKCLFVYRKSDEIKFKMDLDKVFEDTSEYYFEDLEPYEEAPLLCILCPNWEQVFAWFRARGLYSYIRSYIAPENFYIYSIYDNNNFDKCCGRRDTYEEAQQECVKALIQTYKNELEKNNL